MTLATLHKHCSTCYACGLREPGNHVVFGCGDPNADIMIIGEAPGYNEMIDGIPFTGRAGKLLTRIIEKGLGVTRDSVYLANILKCRPPENRDPEPTEIKFCTIWLDEQIKIIDPKIIIPVGKYASQYILNMPNATMGRMRGKIYTIDGRKVVPTWHPAYLLRAPDRNKETWFDIKLVLKYLETFTAA